MIVAIQKAAPPDRRLAPPLAALHGGKYLVVGRKLDVLEGNWRPSRTIIVGFPSKANLRAFYDSAEYAPLKAIRIRSSDSKVVAVEGIQ